MAQIEYLCAMVYADLYHKGVLNTEGEGRRLLDDYRKLRTTQVALSRELGMTPLSRSQLTSNGRSTFDLAHAMAQPIGDAEVVNVPTANGEAK